MIGGVLDENLYEGWLLVWILLEFFFSGGIFIDALGSAVCLIDD